MLAYCTPNMAHNRTHIEKAATFTLSVRLIAEICSTNCSKFSAILQQHAVVITDF